MSGNSPAQWRPEPGPQNALERFLVKAMEDPALHGEMFRRLWEAELTMLMPDHPEMREGFAIGNGSVLTFVNYQDDKGRFIPIYTSEAAAEYAVEKLSPKPYPLMASAPAEVIFRALANGDATRVVLNAGFTHTLLLKPEAIQSIVSGSLRHGKPGGGERKKMNLKPVPVEQVPERLRQGIRVFCTQRRVPIGVYVFHPFDPATREQDVNDFRIVLWLRHENGDFYNDFSLMVQKLMPRRYAVTTGVVTTGDEASLAYIQTCTPLWPVMTAAK